MRQQEERLRDAHDVRRDEAVAQVRERQREREDRLRETNDVRRDDSDRYALYRFRGGTHQELSNTSKEGIGAALVQHVIDGDLTPDDGFGLLDRMTRTWLVNMWAKR